MRRQKTRTRNQLCFEDIFTQESFAALPCGDAFRLLFPPRRIIVVENYVSQKRPKKGGGAEGRKRQKTLVAKVVARV